MNAVLIRAEMYGVVYGVGAVKRKLPVDFMKVTKKLVSNWIESGGYPIKGTRN